MPILFWRVAILLVLCLFAWNFGIGKVFDSESTNPLQGKHAGLSPPCLRHPSRVFIDAGSNDGQSLQWVAENRAFRTDAVFAFEMNPAFIEVLERRLSTFAQKGLCTRLFSAAVWTVSGHISVHLNTAHDVSRSRSSGLLYNMTGSSVFDREEYHCIEGTSNGSSHCKKGGQTSVETQVQSIDLAQFLLDTFVVGDNVFLKMDIEGAEYEVLPRLIQTNALCLVDELAVEWHGNKGLKTDKSSWAQLENKVLPAAAGKCGVKLSVWSL